MISFGIKSSSQSCKNSLCWVRWTNAFNFKREEVSWSFKTQNTHQRISCTSTGEVCFQVNQIHVPHLQFNFNKQVLKESHRLTSTSSDPLSCGNILGWGLCHFLTSDSPPEDPAGSSEVVRSTRRVGVHPLAQESQVLHCRHKLWIRKYLNTLRHYNDNDSLNRTLVSQMVVHVR